MYTVDNQAAQTIQTTAQNVRIPIWGREEEDTFFRIYLATGIIL